MLDRTNLGRNLVAVAIGLILCSSVITIVLYNAVRGSDHLPAQLFRFGLTCLLSWCLWLGMAWARWVSVLLFGIAVVIGLQTAMEFGFANYNTYLLVSYVAAVAILLFGPEVGRHFAGAHP